MTKPRIFISSTFYDLKHIRSSLERFVEDLGFEAILFERGSIPYAPDSPLDESCYRDAASADIFVLIIGGRYGSAASDTQDDAGGFYESVTKKEFETAHSSGTPIYVLIESNVATEYDTYLLNRDSDEIKFAHVDNPNVFRFIEAIYSKPLNNPVHRFERFRDVESFLREQWSGLFSELLRKGRQATEVGDLNSRLAELKSVNQTLKSYLEALLKSQNPDTAESFIEEEENKLTVAKILAKAEENSLSFYLLNKKANLDQIRALAALDDDKLTPEAVKSVLGDELGDEVSGWLAQYGAAREDMNKVRSIFGEGPISFKNFFVEKTGE